MSFSLESRTSGSSGPRKPRIARASRSSGSITSSGAGLHFGGGIYEPAYEDNEKRRFRGALAGAILFHLALLFMAVPDLGSEPKTVGTKQRPLFVVQQVRFQPPAPKKAEQKAVEKKKTRKIPIPDPTPDDPEPLIDEDLEIEIPDLEIGDFGDLMGIPDAPPSPVVGGAPMWIQGDVQPPERIHSPQPRYTEEARKARIQGVVILQAVIDALGNVSRIEVVKGLPEGLEESAVETVRTWKYKPATHEGKAVPVYMNLTITFSLQ
jgi:protein TonB